MNTVTAGASLQLHLVCPWQWERDVAGMLSSTNGRGPADGCPVCPPPSPPAETQSLCLGKKEAGIHVWALEEKGNRRQRVLEVGVW